MASGVHFLGVSSNDPNYRPNEALLEFWRQSVEPFFSALITGCCRFPDVQRLFNENVQIILGRYGRPPGIELYTELFADMAGKKQLTPFACLMKDGFPQVGVFLPDVQALFLQIRQVHPQSFLSVTEVSVILSIMHELDHIALDLAHTDQSSEQHIDCEVRTWARTCSNSIHSLVSCGVEIPWSEKVYYDNWVAYGMDQNSPKWKAFISKMYAEMDAIKMQKP